MSDIFKLDRERRKLEQAITDEACKYSDLVPDDIGRAVIEGLSRELEDMSKGRNEVRWDKEGHPHVMVNFPISPKARLDYLSLGNTIFDSTDSTLKREVHPAYIIDGAVIGGFRLDKYHLARFKGKNIHASLYGMSPAWGSGGFTVSTNGAVGEVARINALSGDGDAMHVETLAEFAYLSMLASRRAFQCHGNTNYTKYHGNSNEQGAPAQYIYNNRTSQTKTGTGPLVWQNDGTPFGVADLVGNMAEWVTGFRLVNEELQWIPDNGAAKEGLSASDLLESSTLFKAMLQDGSFVAPGTENTYKYDHINDTGSWVSFVLAVTNEHSHDGYGSVASGSLTARDGVSVATYLRIMNAFPTLKNVPSGQKYMYPIGTRACVAGGSWNNSSYAGFGFLRCSSSFSGTSYDVGVRSASIIKTNS